ncbi:uncharacterized protein VTP21DRAFT_5205 [Calcarisporiella thermophila]|uniref:uncharacterized protein n=1 Tax=Calcarisporiella thermophila TaxID=911321 RepID=UPI0037430A91
MTEKRYLEIGPILLPTRLNLAKTTAPLYSIIFFASFIPAVCTSEQLWAIVRGDSAWEIMQRRQIWLADGSQMAVFARRRADPES